MVKKRVEVYRDGPAWDHTYVNTRLSWSGDHGFFVLDGVRYELHNNEILCKGLKVGEIRDFGRTLFIGPDDAQTREEYLRARFEEDVKEVVF